LTDLALKNPAAFGTTFLECCVSQGFQSLGKRDVELLVYFLLERDGAIARGASNYEVARRLRITPSRVRSLRRDAYARWQRLAETDRKSQIQALLARTLTEERIKAGARHAAEKTSKEGFLAVLVDHAHDREEFEQAIIDAGGIPVYERNRDVIVVRFDTLLVVAQRFEFLDKDKTGIRNALKALAPGVEGVKDLLLKDVSEIEWDDIRQALNHAAAAALTGAADVKLTKLLKLVFPFMS
jgi:hypothetical protein